MPWGAAIAAGGAIGGSLIGANAQNSSARIQQAIAERQLAEQDLNRNISLASKQDAEGNQVVFDPKTNSWKTILSAPQAQLQTATDREQLQRITHDAPLARQLNDVNTQRQLKEGGIADNYLQDMLHRLQTPEIGNATAAASRLAHGRDVLDAQNAALRGFETQSLRSGNNNILDAIDRSRAETGAQLAHNEADSVKEYGAGPTDSYQKASAPLNLYNVLATRAAGGGGIPAVPAFSGGSALASAMAGSARDSVLAGSGAGSVGNGYLSTLHPDYSGANAVISSSAALGGLWKDQNVQNYLKSLFRGNGNESSGPSFVANNGIDDMGSRLGLDSGY